MRSGTSPALEGFTAAVSILPFGVIAHLCVCVCFTERRRELSDGTNKLITKAGFELLHHL